MSERKVTQAAAALHDSLRRRLFELATRADDGLSIDDAVTQTGAPRSTVALALDRLVLAGVLHARFERRTGRSGPGAGRPAKVYVAALSEVSSSTPAREYELMGDVLASTIELAQQTGTSPEEALRSTARKRGVELTAEWGSVHSALKAVGFDPESGDDGTVTLTNCPFHRLAAAHTDLVCSANLALVQGMLGEESAMEAHLTPAAGRCCVSLAPRDSRTDDTR